MNKKKYEAAKEKDRRRKRSNLNELQESSSASLESSVLSRQSLTNPEQIPKSPGKKELLTKLLATLSHKLKGTFSLLLRKKKNHLMELIVNDNYNVYLD